MAQNVPVPVWESGMISAVVKWTTFTSYNHIHLLIFIMSKCIITSVLEP